jgi:YHS domain-containing protein
MLLLLWILRALIILLILRYVVAFFGRRGPASMPRQSRTPAVRTGGTLVRDPQCGTYVPESSTFSISRSGTMQHFCSAACRDAWAASHPK